MSMSVFRLFPCQRQWYSKVDDYRSDRLHQQASTVEERDGEEENEFLLLKAFKSGFNLSRSENPINHGDQSSFHLNAAAMVGDYDEVRNGVWDESNQISSASSTCPRTTVTTAAISYSLLSRTNKPCFSSWRDLKILVKKQLFLTSNYTSENNHNIQITPNIQKQKWNVADRTDDRSSCTAEGISNPKQKQSEKPDSSNEGNRSTLERTTNLKQKQKLSHNIPDSRNSMVLEGITNLIQLTKSGNYKKTNHGTFKCKENRSHQENLNEKSILRKFNKQSKKKHEALLLSDITTS